jgi:RNA polymerase sigma factor (sigma-70 family)
MTNDEYSGEDFELLLAWLGPDRERSGERYEQLRQNLLDYFRRRGVWDPHSLADEVFIRVTKKVKEVAGDYVGDPARYFFAVARNVLSEWRRQPVLTEISRDIPVEPALETVAPKELLLQGMEHCWALLRPHEQMTLLRYYQEVPQKLRESREQLARELGLTLGALRVTTHRIRVRLRRCIEKTVGKNNREIVPRIAHKLR